MVQKKRNNLKKKIFIKTFGCQMNEYDSNRILDITKKINYFPTTEKSEADCYIINTCHIREKATEKNLVARLSLTEKKYFLKIQVEVLDGRIFLSGKVDEPEEKIKITKLAWETKGVREVKNAITIKGNSNFKQTAKDILITSQLRTALILNKKTKARNYTLETINKKIYIFGIAMDNEEKKEVLLEAEKIYDVEKVIPSIYLASELSRNKI